MYDLFLWVLIFIGLYIGIFFLNILNLKETTLVYSKDIKEYPNLSIIVPAYNEEKNIAGCLQSILDADYPPEKLKLVVVNDASTDNTRQIIEGFKDPRIQLINRTVNSGKKSIVLNEALKHITTKYVGIVDSDSVILKDSIKPLIPYFEDEKVAVVMPMHKVHEPKNLLEKIQSIEYIMAAFSKKLSSVANVLFLAHGVLSIYRKDIIDEIGGFDETNLTEDIEIAVRLNRHGYKVMADKDSIVYTKVPDTLKAYHKQRIRWSRGFYSTMLKHREMIFNKEFGLLGLFIFPIFLTLSFFSMIAVSFIGYSTLRSIYIFIKSPFVQTRVETQLFEISPIFNIDPVMIVLIIMLSFSAYIFSRSIKHLKHKWEFPIATLIFFTIYQPIASCYWLLGFIYELFGVKEKWG